MTREEAIKILKSKMDGSVDTSYEWAETVRMAIEALQTKTDGELISREEVLRTIIVAGECEPDLGYTHLHKVIENLPSAEPKTKCIAQIKVDRDDIEDMVNEMAKEIAEPKTGRDCTDFVRWLMDEVLDEENWEMNAVANGEIICRKLKKLGLIDVKDGYYVETQETGWIPVSEGLPEDNKEVLISCEWGVDLGQHDSEGWRSEWINHYDDDDVLAWQPCPKPYRKDREEYELATEQMEHDITFEPTYNIEDGSM